MNRQLKVSVLFLLIFINILSINANDLIRYEINQEGKSLGSNIKKPTPTVVKIISNTVPETGITSAYYSHQFTIEESDWDISNPQWELVLPESNGDSETTTLTDDNFSCTTPPISDENKYKINSDGVIEGQLFFSCVINGKEINAIPFNIYFELKPVIESATILEIKDNAPYKSYDAYFKVVYRGAERIKVSVEEEYSAKIFSQYIYEPYIAYGVADHITSPYYAWIDFVAENKYGKATYTIELEPYGVVAEVDGICIDNEDDVLEVYNATGLKIGTINDMSDLNSLSYKGLLIIKRVNNNQVIEIIKTYCK